MKITLAWTTIAAALAVAAIGAPNLASAADINVVGADAKANVDVDVDARAVPATSMRGAVAATRAGATAVTTADTTADTTMASDADAADAARAKLKVKIATKDILNKPTALINKNTLAMDNNVFVSRSNIVFSQSDRLALAKKVEQLVTSDAAKSDSPDMTSAVLSKNVLRAVSGSDTDTALMTKASAVVAAKDDASARGMRIADLVNAVFDAKQTQPQMQPQTQQTQTQQTEQSIQTDAPRGVIIMIGTKDILRQPTGVVNKNVVVSDTQVAVARSNIAPSQNDNVALAGNAKVADAVLPASAIDVRGVGASKATTESADADYRVGFLYSKSEAATATAMTATTATTTAAAEKTKDMDKTKDKEQLLGLGGGGFGGGGLGFGWRYPLGYWNLCGAGLYGAGGCGLGLAYGPYYYC